ncbi:MAG: amidase domain-containing protein [Mycetocola sp.]
MSRSVSRSTRARLGSRRLVAAAVIACSALLWAGCASPSTPTATRPQPTSTPTPSAVSAVTAVSPASGSVTGGTTLTITGTGLADVTDVTVGGVPATDVTVTADDTVTAVAPAAVDYQPADAAIVVSAGEKALPQPTALTHSYAVVTGVDAQMQYALAHWDDYNEAEWGNLNPVGGDCANFVSQTLIQRGWVQNSTWFNTNAAADWSAAWGYAPAMDNWFAGGNGPALTRLSLDQRDQVKVGDIGMFDWNVNKTPDHVMLVSSVKVVDGITQIAFVSHNLDGDYRDLDTVITVEHPGANAWFWSIPA